MVQIGNKTLVYSATFPLENNQSAFFAVPQLPEHKFEIQVREKQDIDGVLAGTIMPKFMNKDVILPIPFVKDGKHYASPLQGLLIFADGRVSAQVFVQGFGDLVRVDVSIFIGP